MAIFPMKIQNMNGWFMSLRKTKYAIDNFFYKFEVFFWHLCFNNGTWSICFDRIYYCWQTWNHQLFWIILHKLRNSAHLFVSKIFNVFFFTVEMICICLTLWHKQYISTNWLFSTKFCWIIRSKKNLKNQTVFLKTVILRS